MIDVMSGLRRLVKALRPMLGFASTVLFSAYEVDALPTWPALKRKRTRQRDRAWPDRYWSSGGRASASPLADYQEFRVRG